LNQIKFGLNKDMEDIRNNNVIGLKIEYTEKKESLAFLERLLKCLKVFAEKREKEKKKVKVKVLRNLSIVQNSIGAIYYN